MSCLLEIDIRHEVRKDICRKMWKEIYDYESKLLEKALLGDGWMPCPQLIEWEKHQIFEKYKKLMEEA